jgi:hypothetical protein
LSILRARASPHGYLHQAANEARVRRIFLRDAAGASRAFVDRLQSGERFEARQGEHDRKLGVGYEYEVEEIEKLPRGRE